MRHPVGTPSRHGWVVLVAGSLAAALLVLAFGGPARAADRVPGSLTDVRGEGREVTGVLTVRTDSPLAQGRATARLDGESVPVTLTDEVRSQRTVMLVIDTSGSMGLSGMATVRDAVADYLQTAPRDVRVGVASFAVTAGVDLAPTRDRARVQRVVDSLVSRGDTNLYGGVRSAVEELAGHRGDRSVVLLSDGADTIAEDPTRSLRNTARQLARQGVRLDVVRFNTDDPDAVQALQRLSGAGNGQVSPADDPAAVRRAFTEAAAALESQVGFALTANQALAGRHLLEVTGRAGDTRWLARERVDLDQSVPVAGGTTGTDGEDGAAAGFSVDQRSWLLPVLAATAGAVAIFLLAFVLLAPELRTRRERRLAAIDGYLPWGEHHGQRTQARPTPAAHLVAFSERVAGQRRSASRTQALLHRADLALTPGEWLVVQGLAVVLPVLLAVLLAVPWPLLVLLAVLGGVLPPMVLRFLAARRSRKFERQLPDVLMLLATSLGSGFGLPQAFDAVVQDAGEPLAKEFSRAQAETRLGADLTDALERVAERMESTTLSWTIMAMRIQMDVGGSLAETLRTTAATLRDREALRGQVRTLSAEGRLSAYILISLPIFVFGWMLMVNRDYISLLWTELLGMAMLGGACVLLVVGVFWMRKVVEIEV